MNVDVVELAQRLVRIPSLNPMGRDVTGPPYFEAAVTDALSHWFANCGIETERHTVFPQRDNLVARIPGRGVAAERIVLLEVHQDTVPVDGMTIAPFDAVLRDGRIYGRGACDVKGGMAAILVAAHRIAHSNVSSRPTIVCAFTINEENGFDGINHLTKVWQAGNSRLLPSAPDVAIVAEPTELDVVVAHKGSVRWQCHVIGAAAHSSDPSRGKNAIYQMAKLLDAISEYANQHVATLAHHPLLNTPTLSVGTIEGGISVNTVPDRCTIRIDRRLIPGESGTRAQQNLIDFLQQRCPDIEQVHDAPFLTSPGLESHNNHALANQLASASQANGGKGQLRGVPFGTDAGAISNSGVPTVVFGPGSIEQAHTRDEWIEVASLHKAVDTLVDFCHTFASD